jgi:hypothetical protein
MKTIFRKVIWRLFGMFEHFGIHVIPIEFNSPIPDTRFLGRNMHLFGKEHPLPGVDLNDADHIRLLKTVARKYESEYVEIGNGDFGTDPTRMPSYAPLNALLLYAFIRHFKPGRMIEIGSGISTRIAAAAFQKNNFERRRGSLITVDPYPSETLPSKGH